MPDKPVDKARSFEALLQAGDGLTSPALSNDEAVWEIESDLRCVIFSWALNSFVCSGVNILKLWWLTSRVTRLGDFLTLDNFLKNYISKSKFLGKFCHCKTVIKFYQTWFVLHFEQYFHKSIWSPGSQTYLTDRVERKYAKNMKFRFSEKRFKFFW
jgi:hypothetical protein